MAHPRQTPLEFVNTHLAHELEYMLMAATTWCAWHDDTRDEMPKHLGATAEYAAFVHHRSMYEFFCEDDKQSCLARGHVGCQIALQSQIWDDWRRHINAAVAHLKERWKNAPPVHDDEQLKNQVAVFSMDLVRLWSELERNTPADISAALVGHRLRVLDYVDRCAVKMGTPSLDWGAPDPFANWGARKWWPVCERD
jgi:hypothetical protein